MYDPVTCSWRTRQCSLFGDLAELLETWPEWGMTLGGECWEQTMPVLHTSEKEFGFWPTPQANEDAAGTPDGNMQWMLSHAVRANTKTRKEYQQWKESFPTPVSSDYKGASKKRIPGTPEYRSNLCEYVENGGNPTLHLVYTESLLFSEAMLKTTPALPVEKITRLARALALQKTALNITKTATEFCGGRGYLSPMWTEWLMGWPIGWTDLKPLETDKFRKWLRSHGVC